MAMVDSFIPPWGTRYLTQSTSIRRSRRLLPQSNRATLWFFGAFYTIIWERATGVSVVPVLQASGVVHGSLTIHRPMVILKGT